MPRFQIKITHRPNIQAPVFRAEQMREIGEHALTIMKERLATGTDVLDKPAKPLQPKYAERKAKKGRPAIRDLRLTGNLLGSTQVTEVDTQHVQIKVRGATPYRKGIFNQNIDPWFGLSDHDTKLLDETIQPIFSHNLADALK